MSDVGKRKSDHCEGCNFQYDDIRRPHILGCGHSLCSCCLLLKITVQFLSCPVCRTEFKTSRFSDFPVNYSLENCISTLRKLRGPDPAVPPEPVQKEKSSHSGQELIDYQKQSAQDLIRSSKDLAEDLKTYHDSLKKNLNEHKEIRRLIQSRAQYHRTISGRMNFERDTVMEVKKKLDALIKKLSGELPKLNSASGIVEVAGALTRVTNTYRELASCVDSCQEDYPDDEMAIFQRLLTRSMNVVYMEDFEYVKQDEYLHQCPFDEPSIMDKLNICKIEDFVTVDNLRSDVERWKGRIRRHALVAASWENGQRRMTYLTEQNDRIYLNCLYDNFPSAGKYVIEHKEILTCVKSNPTVAFLKLAWGYQTKGRVHIELSLDTPMAQHFKGLCTGELGPSYSNTKLSEVIHPGSVMERMTSGPCEGSFYGGDVSKDTLGFNEAIYKRKTDQGIIWMDSTFSFSILTGVGRGCIYNNVFGQVTDGLDLLLESAERVKKGLGDVEIVESGVILEI